MRANIGCARSLSGILWSAKPGRLHQQSRHGLGGSTPDLTLLKLQPRYYLVVLDVVI